MKQTEILERLAEEPIIAAVKSEAGLEKCLTCESRVVFVLYGSILTIPQITQKISAAGKTAFVHLDLVDGLSPREAAVDFLSRSTAAGGIISTKPALLRYAGAAGLLTIQRLFLLDSMALENARRQLESERTDFVEILPGVAPKAIRRLREGAKTPLIAGGLIVDKEDVMSALSAGAVAVSSTKEEVWFL